MNSTETVGADMTFNDVYDQSSECSSNYYIGRSYQKHSRDI